MEKVLFVALFIFYLALAVGQASDFNSVISKYYENKPKELKEVREWPKTCAEASNGTSGVYTIEIPYTDFGPFPVACDAEFLDGNWLVIQRRMDGSVDFFRPWAAYKQGFGDVEGEFFIGLDKLHYLTAYKPHELLVVVQDFDNVTKYAKYYEFVVGSEAESYILQRLGQYSGTAGDSLTENKLQKFSTYDNVNHGGNNNCARNFIGAWWYKYCGQSNLNGLYLKGVYQAPVAYGVSWQTFEKDDFYSFKFVQMMIRPDKDYNN